MFLNLTWRTQWQIFSGGGQKREAREREDSQQQQQREEDARRVKARAEKAHFQEEGVAEKRG